MKVKDIMCPVLKASSSNTVSYIARLMDRHKTGSIILSHDGEFRIVTERDILKKVVAKGNDPSKTLARDVVSNSLITLPITATVDEASRLMTEHNIRRIPIIENNAIIGKITTQSISQNLKFLFSEKLQKKRLVGDKVYVRG